MEYIPHGTFLKRNVHMMGVHFDPPSLVFQKRPVGEGGGLKKTSSGGGRGYETLASRPSHNFSNGTALTCLPIHMPVRKCAFLLDFHYFYHLLI